MITSVHRQPFIGRRLNRRALNDSCSCGSRRVSTRKMWCKYTLIYRINFVVWPNQSRYANYFNRQYSCILWYLGVLFGAPSTYGTFYDNSTCTSSSCNSSSVYNNYYTWQCIVRKVFLFCFTTLIATPRFVFVTYLIFCAFYRCQKSYLPQILKSDTNIIGQH